jgi:hypothetical protein
MPLCNRYLQASWGRAGTTEPQRAALEALDSLAAAQPHDTADEFPILESPFR